MRNLRYLILFALCLAPVASAGVSVSADILPASTSSCEEWESESFWEGSSEWNGTTYWWYSYGRSDGESCESSTDTARANVTANDANVASVRSGESHRDSQSWNYRGDGYAVRENDSEETFAWRGGEWTARGERSDIRETTVTTDVASARAAEGCTDQWYWQGAGQGSAVWRQPQDAPSEYHESGTTWGESSGGYRCESAATLTSGVTTLRAGRDSGCQQTYREQGAWSYDYTGGNESSPNGTWRSDSFSSRSGTSDCNDEYGASAGSERVSAGSRRHCDDTGGQHHSTVDGAWTSSHESQSECTDDFGVWGPTGLAVTRRGTTSSSWNCSSSDGDEGSCLDTYEQGPSSLVVSQRYVGETGLPLP